MPDANPDKLLELFAQAERLGGEARVRFVENVAREDPGLGAELRDLLDQCDSDGPVPAQPTAAAPEIPGPTISFAGAAPAHPERIGPYRILDVLGEGGMGTVYVAEQQAPVRRRVALKVIKLGMDSVEVLRRFEAERQALAMMNHDGIAKVFDAGTNERGQPYFVMEYVPGLPLTEYCDKQRLGTAERLRLFQEVCEGVQHAHQKGVIHRDLKPSNILVTEHQGRASPKIIDFGVAKAMDHRLTEQTIFTAHGQPIGTPEYMSPEQAEATSADIDTRTDIYSLGVILYELLVGGLPIPLTELRAAGLREIQRRIREDDPPKPSTRISTLGAESEYAAQRRQTTVSALVRELRGDLDWIVMMAMSKDRNRRYGTAAALAEDLARHLQHEPVMAGPPSAGYRARKLIRRYRGQVVAAGAVLLALLVGLVGTTYFMFSAFTARDQAQANLDNFNQLADVVKLRDAQAAEQDLYPAWPEKIDAMQAWLAESELLEERIPVLEAALGALRATTDPTAEDLETWRQRHPRHSELVTLRGKLTALQRADATRSGGLRPETVLDAAVSEDAGALNLRAWPLVDPDREEFGREAEGLALARMAWQAAARDPELRPFVADTLAWALFANGLDEEAVSMSEAALAAAPEASLQEYRDTLTRMSASVETARGEGGAAALAALANEIEALEAELAQRSWSFEDRADQFLYDTLTTVVDEIEAFASRELGQVRARLAWAERLDEVSTAAAPAWEAARVAIGGADGVTASRLYASEPPLDLQAQTGLVPIGMNPVTGLWEFYHLRSAADPEVIPRHDDQGNIEVTETTGIIFVLIPGGSFLMGAQNADPAGRNYDPLARPEEPLQEHTLEPFFLARHELTQAQWQRLSGGETPSGYPAGYGGLGLRTPVSKAHPVEQVSWDMCHELLIDHGLDLPSEPAWEYACRAGTSTPWSTGAARLSLAGAANILDATGAAAVANWGDPEGFDDGFILHAPVGSFLPNEFGLFDMHGNVWEWCHDLFGSSPTRILRGGSFILPAPNARAAYRMYFAPSIRNGSLGVRPARALQ